MSKLIDINKYSEGVHYELIPGSDDDSQSWNVRILEGYYVETVIEYGKIKINHENESLSFDFKIISSPIEEIKSHPEFINYVGSILSDVLFQASAEGNLQTTPIKES